MRGFLFGCLLGALAMSVVLTGASRAHPKPLPRHFVSGALCIHRHEGSWTDPDAPYYGGMQMDISFMRAYGRRLLRRKGTADHWTPHEQLHVAYRGYRARGWWPWPNTARMCGLL